MFGLILIACGTALEEVASVIGKYEVAKRRESIYTMGFLNSCWTIVIFLFLIFVFHQPFVFVAASLPIFAVRTVLEILQAHATMVAIAHADRSTYSFVRTLTIPLLLVVDVVLAYAIRPRQLIGMIVVMTTLLFIFWNRNLSKRAVGFVLFTAMNAVATISLYKYNIAHYNSVAAEGLLIYVILLTYFVLMAKRFARENPFTFLRKRIFFLQSATHGVAGVVESFAYNFAPASIILTAKRSTAVLWTIFSGRLYFHEQHLLPKVLALVFLVLGLILLV